MAIFFAYSTKGFYDDRIHAVLPNDAVAITADERSTLQVAIASGKVIASDAKGKPTAIDKAPSIDEMKAANTAAIQAKLDDMAQSKGYDNIVSACSYAAQGVGAPFQAEGAAFLTWRSAVWKHAYDVLQEVDAGNRAMPTPEESVAMMPLLVLP